MSLTRDAILNAKDSKVKEIDVPEWGGVVHLREMSGRERFALQDRMEELVKDAEKEGAKGDEEVGVFIIKRGARAELLVRCLCDKEGALIFSTDDIDAIEEKNSLVVQRVFEEASEFNGMNDEKDPGKQEKEAAKN